MPIHQPIKRPSKSPAVRVNPNQYSAIESIALDWNKPGAEVAKATVVRAKAINQKTGEASITVTQTYFIGKDVNHYTLPVVSLVVDPDDLFNGKTGIYVLGEKYISFSKSDDADSDNQVLENFQQHGRDWERPVHFEIFESDDKQAYSQNGGIRIHGSSSRSRPQKSFAIYARDEYDPKDLVSYPLFTGQTDGSKDSDGKVYRSFLLRNSGQD
jgi:hypothetical protein